MKRNFKLYARPIDAGHGTQFVETKTDGTITKQWLAGIGNHSYTGEGNPEFVGQNIATVNRSRRDFTFKQVRLSDEQYLAYVENDFVPAG